MATVLSLEQAKGKSRVLSLDEARALPNMTVVPKGGAPRQATQADMADMPDPTGDEWLRGAIIPFARHQKTGELSFAMPGIIQDAINAATLPG